MINNKINNGDKKMRKRAISQIMGSLMMMAIVAMVGSVFLVQGMQGINEFNNTLQNFIGGQNDGSRESLLIEHVRFNATNDVNNLKRVDIWVRNTGTVAATIDRVTMVRIDTQELLINEDATVNEQVPIRTLIQINGPPNSAWKQQTGLLANLNTCTSWIDTAAGCTALEYTNNKEYRIAITTNEGNIFETTVKPFNT